LDALIEGWTQERDRDELVSSLQGVGVAAGMALSDKDLTKDPHLRETGYFHSLERRYAGVHEYPRAPIRLSRSPQQEPTAAPTLGQYNEYVLSDILGFTKDELQEMRTDKVIGERLSDA
jgi:benzylsuccinate CoA-transferase BbsF subunit/naphthyl-2-methylsuccinate CoA transferase subunit